MHFLSIRDPKNKSDSLGKGAHISEKFLALGILVALSPVFFTNTLLALISFKRPLKAASRFLNQDIKYYRFNTGLFKDALVLINVVLGRCHLVGESTTGHYINDETDVFGLKSGLINTSLLRSFSGIHDICRGHDQVLNLSFLSKLGLVLRFFISSELFKEEGSHLDSDFSLFNVRVNNETLEQALEEIVPTQSTNETNLFFFINVNSINQARSSDEFTAILNQSHKSYADGSGMRIGARRIGVSLKDNLNGTDLFPHICQRAQAKQKSVYMLGAAPGVADAAANWVSKQYPLLNIAGVQHGYFSPEENEALVESINESGADILLVAMGSPVQEGWLVANQSKLTCESALAVGGLFDFYSGRISRAPMWVRELGMEWIWRLANEPVKKFKRYVIGNPWFMFGLFSKAPHEVGQTIK